MIEVVINGKSEVSENEVADLLCTGFEGGIGYWAKIVGYKKPEKIFDWNMNTLTVYKYVQYPMSEGGAVILRDSEGDDEWELNLDRVKSGLSVMASRYPRHYANFINDQYDAETGDVFIQCCLFKEVVFG